MARTWALMNEGETFQPIAKAPIRGKGRGWPQGWGKDRSITINWG